MVFYVLILLVCALKLMKTGLMFLDSWIAASWFRMITLLPTPVTPVNKQGFSFSRRYSRHWAFLRVSMVGTRSEKNGVSFS